MAFALGLLYSANKILPEHHQVFGIVCLALPLSLFKGEARRTFFPVTSSVYKDGLESATLQAVTWLTAEGSSEQNLGLEDADSTPERYCMALKPLSSN